MNTASLFLGLIFSSIGLGYFIYGKRQRMNMPFICGITLMIFPYFIENTMIMSVCG
ncbi:MAG: amino acid transport protein, partial [Acinetobacter sp.]|nr:amino acid transport protein [Acinetobacter sp.]